MTDILKTEAFITWVLGLRDETARAKIAARLDRLAMDNPDDIKLVGGGVSELRIDHGPGYRVYLTRRGTAVALLCGGDKRTQGRDIKRAQKMVAEFERATWPS